MDSLPMDGGDLSPVADKPSGDAPEENWMEMIKELKAINKNLEEKLAASEESEVLKKNQAADLEKERDNWKKMAEEEKQKNEELIEKMKLSKKAAFDLLYKNEKYATRRQEAMRKLLNEKEKQVKELKTEKKQLEDENDDLLKRLWTPARRLKERTEKWRSKLDGYGETLTKLLSNAVRESTKAIVKIVEENNQLKQQLAILKGQETLADCKICLERPVQNVFSCGHAACDICYERILTMEMVELESKKVTECHICPKGIEQNPQKIYFT